MRFAAVCMLVLTIGCSRPSSVQTVLDTEWREVADLEAELTSVRQEIAGLKREGGKVLADLEAGRKRLSQDVTPPIPQRPQRPVSLPTPRRAILSTDSPWRCETCGKPMMLDDHVEPHHVDGEQGHPAKLSNADLKILADGLAIPH